MQPDTVPATPQNIIGLQKLDESNKALKKVLSDKEGRQVIAEIFRTFHMYSSPHQDHGAKTSFNCGQQSVCLWLREWMKNAGVYEFYHQIEKEDMERSEHWETALKKLVENPKQRS